MPAVADTLRSNALTPRELESVAVALGPGGFSSLRVGVSAAKGLVIAAKLPIVGISTLDMEAFPYQGMGLPVCALLDAGRGELSSALFGPDGHRLRDDLIITPAELANSMLNTTFEKGTVLGPTVFCGEGVVACAQLVRERLGANALVMARHNPATRLSSLVELARQRLASGDTDNLATLQPYYLRLPSIGGPKTRDRVPQQS